MPDEVDPDELIIGPGNEPTQLDLVEWIERKVEELNDPRSSGMGADTSVVRSAGSHQDNPPPDEAGVHERRGQERVGIDLLPPK